MSAYPLQYISRKRSLANFVDVQVIASTQTKQFHQTCFEHHKKQYTFERSTNCFSGGNLRSGEKNVVLSTISRDKRSENVAFQK